MFLLQPPWCDQFCQMKESLCSRAYHLWNVYFAFFFSLSPAERCCFSNAQGLHFFFAGGVASFAPQQGVFFFTSVVHVTYIDVEGDEVNGRFGRERKQ